MPGCNCPEPSFDNACCRFGNEGVGCSIPVPKNFYCGYCDGAASIAGCQLWLDCCAAMKFVNTLSMVRFKTQAGRDSVFNILRFPSAIQMNKYTRFPPQPVVSLNSPAIFDILASVAAAASYRDRLGEKTHNFGRKPTKLDEKSREPSRNWSYNDASTAYHKSIVLLKTTIRNHAISRTGFERKFSLSWVQAGTPVITTGDIPRLGQLNKELLSSCFNLWVSGAFSVSTRTQKELAASKALKYDETFIVFPTDPWGTPIPCEGTLLVFRPTAVDLIEYKYDCRQFQFGDPVTGSSSLNELHEFVKSAEKQYETKFGSKMVCRGWFDTLDNLVDLAKHVPSSENTKPEPSQVLREVAGPESTADPSSSFQEGADSID